MSNELKKNISLSAYTTLKVGGVADYFSEVSDVYELKAVLQAAKKLELQPLVIGGGSNLLFSDDGYKGVVIKNCLGGMSYQDNGDAVSLTCGSGETLDVVVADSVSKGYWGLENLSAIPGTIGATPIQNVGAYGVEVSDLVTELKAIHISSGEERIFSSEECDFKYRDSYFKTEAGRSWIIVSVTFTLQKEMNPKLSYADLKELSKVSTVTPAMVREKVIEIRAGKFPDWHKVGTAGSFFKNPTITIEKYQQLKKDHPDLPGYETQDGVKISLGWVLDKMLGLRGYCSGDVCLYEQQALVLTNTGDSAAAIIAFQSEVKGKVKEVIGIDIEPEVTFI